MENESFGSPVSIGLLKFIKPGCRMFTTPKLESGLQARR